MAHGRNLANFATSLLFEPIRAWRRGPVVPSLYHGLEELGRESIVEVVKPVFSTGFRPVGEAPRVPFDRTDAAAIIEATWNRYGRMSPIQLSDLTHERGTPPSIVTFDGVEIAPWLITPDELIARCFENYLNAGG